MMQSNSEYIIEGSSVYLDQAQDHSYGDSDEEPTKKIVEEPTK